jgi:hypothetical protein
MRKPDYFEQKKGDPAALCGVTFAYAKVTNADTPENQKSPVHEMAKSGLLTATGDYRTQHSLEDFLKKELGLTLDDLSNPENAGMAGLPENMNPDFIKRKIESLKGLGELIPTPAKLLLFDTEQEILAQSGDIYYLGEFERLSNANLAVNAFPILYQALYREQAARAIAQEIEKMLSTAFRESGDAGHYSDDLKSMEKRILTEFLPEIIYNRKNRPELEKWVKRLRAYMGGYKYPGEVDTIIDLACREDLDGTESRGRIELYVKKIAAFLQEDYNTVARLKKKIDSLKPV